MSVSFTLKIIEGFRSVSFPIPEKLDANYDIDGWIDVGSYMKTIWMDPCHLDPDQHYHNISH